MSVVVPTLEEPGAKSH